MKIVIRTFIFHMICIFIFSSLYLYFENDFISADGKKKRKEFVDFLLLGTSIQSGIGFSTIYPSTTITKIIMIVQQLLMISTHIFTIYFLTL
jgi:hypothetical protein